MCGHLLAGVINTSCVIPGEQTREASTWSPGPAPTYLFPLLIALCAICSNHSHEYDYMLTLMSSPIKSPSLEVILDNFNTAPYSLLLQDITHLLSFHYVSKYFFKHWDYNKE